MVCQPWACAVLYACYNALLLPLCHRLSYMQDASLNFLKTLLQTPSPSGFERPIQDVVRAWAQPLAQEMRTDRHGNVIAALNPEGKPRIMLAGTATRSVSWSSTLTIA